jgi:hypothetical protein
MDELTADEKLARYAKRDGGGRWWFSDPRTTHDRKATLAIIDACLVLEVPVTDLVTSQAWLKLVRRVADLEARIG